jgi:hypothetical protein
MRGELVGRAVDAEAAVAVQYDHDDIHFAILVGIDAAAWIEVREVDVEIFAAVEGPVNTVPGQIRAAHLIESLSHGRDPTVDACRPDRVIENPLVWWVSSAWRPVGVEATSPSARSAWT